MKIRSKMLSNQEKEIIQRLNHPLYTAEFMGEWIGRSEGVLTGTWSSIQVVAARGYYEAIRWMAEKGDEITFNCKSRSNAGVCFGTLGEGKGYPAV